MAKKKGKKKVKAPSGLDISRDGTKYQLSWSRGGGYTSQDARYFIKTNNNSVPKDDSFKKLSPSAKATSKKIPFDNADYYPNKKDGKYKPKVEQIICYVKGKKGSGSWHKSDKKKQEFKPPRKPVVSSELTTRTSSTFTWEIDARTNDFQPYTRYEWQTVLVKNDSHTDGSKLPWSTFKEFKNSNLYQGQYVNDNNSAHTSEWFAQNYNWSKVNTIISGTGTNTSFSREIIEDSSMMPKSGVSYTRWFRVRSMGPAGPMLDSSKHIVWTYSKHVYSMASRATDVKSNIVDNATNTGYLVTLTWKAGNTAKNPQDVTVPQYAFTVPNSSSVEKDGKMVGYISCPVTSYEDAGNITDTKDLDGIQFPIDNRLSENECLYARINTYHDEILTPGNPILVKAGQLSPPEVSIIRPILDDPSGPIIYLKFANNSLENSFVAVHYCIGDSMEIQGTIGVIPGSGSQEVTINAPNWGNETINIGLQTFVATYSPISQASSGVTNYQIEDVLMESSIVWDDGVPNAPENVTATPIENRMSIEVSWDWPWTEADTTELSWSDHDDAWESTDEPSTYLLSNVHTGRWRIGSLSVGTWYVRVRLLRTTDNGYIYGVYSETKTVKLAAQPITPNLTILPPSISVDDTFKCTWAYSAIDGTQQQNAEICECYISDYYPVKDPDPQANPHSQGWYELVNGNYILTEDTSVNSEKTYYKKDYVAVDSPDINTNPQEQGWYELVGSSYILTEDTTVDSEKTYYTEVIGRYKTYSLPIVQTNSAQSSMLSPKDLGWQAGSKHYLCVRVISTAGEQSADWSEPAPINIVDPLVITIDSVTPSENFVEYTYEIDDDATGSENYSAVESPDEFANPKSEGWYELVGSSYILTEDTELVSGKTYYIYYAKTIMALKELPITVTASGIQDDGTMEFSILRDSDYHIDRPDENDLEGYLDEVVASQTITGSGSVTFDSMIFNQESNEWEAGNLIRPLDDTARYRIEVTGRDTYGQVASATPIKFEVHWTHQAIEPEADIEIDEENYVAYITPTMPESGYVSGDTCDIYRLSIDKPQLIIEEAKFGTKYVDPYPTLGKYGGHRIVYKTKNGDYKLPKPVEGSDDDGDFAMADFEKDEGDFLDVFAVIINFGDDRVILPFDISLSHTWNKDFTETKYLGGSIIGDWNPAVSRTGSIETRVLLDDRKPEELTTIEALRRLAVYSGVCHVRTPDGSSFAADVEVSENREERWVSKISSFSMTVTRIDSDGFDGELYSDWIVSQGEV